MRIILEPGDMTRYEFLIEKGWGETLIIAGCPRFDLYAYSEADVFQLYSLFPDLEDREASHDSLFSSGIFQYIIGHSNCNPWTARAAVIAMKKFITSRDT